jgi:penicillin-binding protein 2
MSIGQGYVLASPLQVAQMTAAIANDGVVLRPRLVQKVDADAAPLPVVSQSKLPASANTLQAIRAGMDGVVSHPGFGTAQRRFASFDWYFSGDAFIAGNRLTRAQRAAARKLSVAGKSGTAQAPGATEKPFAWFTAYAPADQPAIAVTVLLENAGEGSVQAAPLVRQILEAYFGLPISAAPREVASGEND